MDVFFLPQLSQGVTLTFISLNLGCELSSSTSAQGEAGQSGDGLPLLWQRLEGERRSQAAQPHCEEAQGLCTRFWSLLHLVCLPHYTGREGLGDKALAFSFIPYLLSFLRNFTLISAPSPASACVGWFPLSICADSTLLPLCTHRESSQTPMHRERWLQRW